MDELAPCVGASFAITMAWAWWWIMPDMKLTSASVNGVAVPVGLGVRDGSGIAVDRRPDSVVPTLHSLPWRAATGGEKDTQRE